MLWYWLELGITLIPPPLTHGLRPTGGYVSGDLFVWGSVNSLGLAFEGKVANSQIKAKLDQGKVVVLNVRGGGHWVLAYGYNGDKILVNDSNHDNTYYTLSEIVEGQNGVFNVRAGDFKGDIRETFL